MIKIICLISNWDLHSEEVLQVKKLEQKNLKEKAEMCFCEPCFNHMAGDGQFFL